MSAELSTIYRQIAEGKGKEYELLFSLQGLFFAVTEFDPVTDEPLHSTVDDILHGLAHFNIEEYGWYNDRLQHIVDFVSSAIRNLIEVLHEKNIREHRITRPERVREVDSRCMMWLAKKPGFTIKQKIASEQRMMGVYHSTSLDTAENRLFKAFMEKLDDLLSEKSNAARKCGKQLNNDAERFTATVHNWLKSEECFLIGRWNNMPPNNTLLNDKSYRKIWKANIWLQNLNEDIEKDLKRLDELKKHADFWLAAAKLNRSDNIRFRQKVLFPNYKKLSFSDERELGGFLHSDEWKIFKVSSEKECLALNVFAGEISEKNIFPEKRTEPQPVAAVDLNSILPNFTLKDGTKGAFTKKLLHQSHRITHKDKTDWYPCSSARSKLIDSMHDEIEIKTFSIHSIFNSDLHTEADEGENKPLIEKACYDFARTIKDELHCHKCIYVTCDDVEDFSPSVNAFKHSMNTAFPKTEIMPRSIAALFAHLPEIQKKFSDGNEFTVCADYDGYKIETKIQIVINDKLKLENKDTKGIQFKRLKYKKIIERSGETISGLSEKLHLIISLSDTALLKDRFSADTYHFASKHIKKQQSSGDIEIFVPSDFDLSAGALKYERLQSITPDIPLWLDCLPKLAMIDSTGKEFVLVDPEKVPVRTLYRETTEIPISWHFNFPAGKPFYEFPLLQGEKKEKSNYFAFIEDTSFPLEQETECRLFLTYTYGVPKPYHLEFIPVSRPAKFKSVEVKWENESHRDYIHIVGPQYIIEDDWETVCAEDIKGKSNLELLDQTIQNTQDIAENGWVTSKIKDYIPPRNGEEVKIFLLDRHIKGIQCSCYRSKFPKDCQLDIGMEISSSFTRFYNKKGNLCWSAFDPLPVNMKQKRSDYFYQNTPVVNLWDQGRSTLDADFPAELSAKIKELSDAAVTILENPKVPKATKDGVCIMLAALHRDAPESLYMYLNTIIENSLKNDESIQESIFNHRRLVPAFAYAVGKVELPWQKDLLKKEILLAMSEYEEAANFGIEMLGIALWKTREGIFHLDAEEIKNILAASVQTIEKFIYYYKIKLKNILNSLEKISKSDPIFIWRKRFLFLKAVELILALYRVREQENETILRAVAPAPDNTEITKLKSLFPDIEEFCRKDIECSNYSESNQKESNNKIYKKLNSRIRMEIQDENRDTTIPDYLYALEKYTNGDDCNIKILSIDDDKE